MLLEIKDLHVSVGEQKKQILKGLNLTVKKVKSMQLWTKWSWQKYFK